jgi:RNA polymerase sigma-70 factor (ECF subfamily)
MDTKQEELLQQARELDQQALAEIYDSYSTGLYGYALRLLGEPNLAEECVAETFSRYLHAIHAGKGPKKQLKAYLYRIAHNWIVDLYRRSPEQCLPLEEGINLSNAIRVEEQVDRRILANQLRTALFQLTPDQRQVIMLVFIEGWRKAEVAAALGKPVGAVKSLQYRGINSLRKILEITEIEVHNEAVRKYARSTT